MSFFVSLNQVYDYAVKIAEQRHQQKKHYNTHLMLSDNYEIVGVLGEMVFSLIVQKEMDVALRPSGDNGFDFDMINIKTSEEHKARHLIEFVDKSFNGFYVFVIVNLELKYGYVKGYIHSSDFYEMAKIVDFGYGPRRALSLNKLNPYTPKNPLVLNNIYQKHTTTR